MIYICDKCLFIFERVGEVDSCPDCGGPDIREATETEKGKFVEACAESEPGGRHNK
jgi:rRNA maturation endonuclease Nob1